MKVNEPTERYEDRSSNLMHAYYAVNSVDGRRKQSHSTDTTEGLDDYFSNVMEQGALFFDAFFSFNFKWDGIVPQPAVSVLPKIKATPGYQKANPSQLNNQTEYNGVPPNTKRPNVRNTTNK